MLPKKRKRLASSKAERKKSRWNSYFWMLVNTVTWGAAFIAVKPALSVTTPIRYLFYRYILASLLSLPLLWHYKGWLKNKAKKLKKIFLPLVIIELLGTTLALWLIYAGLSKTTAIEANLLSMAMPIFVTIGGILFLREKQEGHEWLGLGIALLGTSVLVLIPVILNGGHLPDGLSITGNVLLLAAMIVDAAYYLLAKKYYKAYPKFLITTLSFYVGLVSFGFLMFWELCSGNTCSSISIWQTMQADLSHPSVWIAAAYMATFGSIIGLTAYYQGQDGIEASEASLFTYLQPLIAIPLGIVLLGENVYALQIVALALIIAGVVLAERRSRH